MKLPPRLSRTNEVENSGCVLPKLFDAKAAARTHFYVLKHRFSSSFPCIYSLRKAMDSVALSIPDA